MAELGAIRQDAAWLRLVRLEIFKAILLVKFDFKTRLEMIVVMSAAAVPFCRCPIASAAPPLQAERLRIWKRRYKQSSSISWSRVSVNSNSI